MKTKLFQITLGLLLLSLHVQQTALAQNDPYVDLQLVNNHTALEAKIAYRSVAPSFELFLASLWNDGVQNILDLHRFAAGPGGVNVSDTKSSVDAGAAFGLGDFCIGPTYAVLPYINNDFRIHYARWNLTSGAVTTAMINVFAMSTHTTTDCSTLDDGTFVISSTNFGGVIDYYNSTNQGASWSFDYRYTPPAGEVTGPFKGGYRATSDAVGNDVGTVLQHSDGTLQAIKVDLGANTALGPVSVYSHLGHIGNGSLKECDGYRWGMNAIGLCNSGSEAWSGWIDISNGSLGTAKLNDVAVGSELGFQGVSVSGGHFPFGGFRSPTGGGSTQYHFFTDKHVAIEGAQGWSNPVLVPGYPFAGHGGSVDSVTIPELNRIYVVGVAVDQNANPYFAVATLNPLLVFDAIFSNGFELLP